MKHIDKVCIVAFYHVGRKAKRTPRPTTASFSPENLEKSNEHHDRFSGIHLSSLLRPLRLAVGKRPPLHAGSSHAPSRPPLSNPTHPHYSTSDTFSSHPTDKRLAQTPSAPQFLTARLQRSCAKQHHGTIIVQNLRPLRPSLVTSLDTSAVPFFNPRLVPISSTKRHSMGRRETLSGTILIHDPPSRSFRPQEYHPPSLRGASNALEDLFKTPCHVLSDVNMYPGKENESVHTRR